MAVRTCPGTPLSDRELEVAQLAASGLTSRQIAGRLVLSARTVESHLRHTYAKTGAGNRVLLLRWLKDQDGEMNVPRPGLV